MPFKDWPSDWALKQEAHPEHTKDSGKKVNERKWNPVTQKPLLRKPEKDNQLNQPNARIKNCISHHLSTKKLEESRQRLKILWRQEKNASKTQISAYKLVEKVAKAQKVLNKKNHTTYEPRIMKNFTMWMVLQLILLFFIKVILISSL